MRKLLICLALILSLHCRGATVWWAITNWDETLATNAFQVWQVGENPTLNGYYFQVGPRKFITPTGGFYTNVFGPGLYQALIYRTAYSNIFFAVPQGGGTYCMTNLLHSGANFYNFTPGVMSLTSTGGTVSVTSPVDITGSWNLEAIGGNATNAPTFLQSTNIAAYQAQAATNTLAQQFLLDPITNGLVQCFDSESTFTLNGNQVTRVSDLSGNGNDWTQSSLTYAPYIVVDHGRKGLYFGQYDDTRWMTNAGIAFDTASYTVIAVSYQIQNGPAGHCLISRPGVFFNLDVSGDFSTKMAVQNGVTVDYAPYLNGGAINDKISSWVFTSTNVFFRDQGREDTVANDHPETTGTGTALGMFNNSNPCYFRGILKAVRIYDRILTKDELLREESYLAPKHGLRTVNGIQIAFDGDSISAGVGCTNGLSWPRQLSNVRSFSGYSVANAGKSLGPGSDSMIQQATNSVDTAIDTNCTAHILCVFGGSNDKAIGGVASATLHTTLSNYCAGRKAIGWRPIVFTMLPRGDCLDSERASFNTLIRANWQGYADALCDVGADPRIGIDTQTNSSYFAADKIHPSEWGNAVIAELADQAIERLLGEVKHQASAPTAAEINPQASGTNHVLRVVNGALYDYWSDGTSVYSQQVGTATGTGQTNDAVVEAGSGISITTNGPTGGITKYTIATSGGAGATVQQLTDATNDLNTVLRADLQPNGAVTNNEARDIAFKGEITAASGIITNLSATNISASAVVLSQQVNSNGVFVANTSSNLFWTNALYGVALHGTADTALRANEAGNGVDARVFNDDVNLHMDASGSVIISSTNDSISIVGNTEIVGKSLGVTGITNRENAAAGVVQSDSDGHYYTTPTASLAGYSLTNAADRTTYTTNGAASHAFGPEVPDPTINQGANMVTTNASYDLAGFRGMVARYRNIWTYCISNSAAGNITVAGPPTARYIGAASTNSMVLPSGKQGYWTFDIIPGVRSNVFNCVEQ